MSTALTESKKPLSLRDHLESDAFREQLAMVLPKHMTADRMARVAITALTRIPKLAECTQSSFFRCLLDLAAWGLEPDGRRAHLIPYGKECTLILDYKGIVELAYRSGYVRNIHADIVRDGDDFAFSLGKVVRHVPWEWRTDDGKPESAGEILGAYAVVELRDGASHCEIMTKEQIDAIRNRSKAGRSGPWVTDYAEMAKKTVFRRASKWLPLSSEVVDAFDRDDDSLPPIERRASKVATVALEDLMRAPEAEVSEDGKLFETEEGYHEEGM